jgi:Protein of unknown function (DUF1538)
VSGALVDEIAAAAWSVVIAVAPLGALFLAFQLFLLKLPRDHVGIIVTGAMVAAVGLFLFLLGIGIGFLPFGRAIGAALATLDQPWLFVIVGLLLGYLTTWGEPAVRVLADQVEHASQGSIHKSLVLYAICIGVALMVGLGVVRISYDIPLLYLLAPGYMLAIGLMWLSASPWTPAVSRPGHWRTASSLRSLWAHRLPWDLGSRSSTASAWLH